MSNFRLSSDAASLAADAVTGRLSGGRLRIYSGTQPSSPERAASADAMLLAELTFATPAYRRAVNGIAEAYPLGAVRATGTGRASWCRMLRADGSAGSDGDVGPEGSGANLELGTVAVSAGAEVLITRLIHVQPMAAA